MSAAHVIPYVWATAGNMPAVESTLELSGVPESEAESATQPAQAQPEIAFYRKYTEGLLRRYLRCSMESGKVPSLLGKEMFRGKVSSYRMESFEDVIIFIRDVESCLARLDPEQQELVTRIAIQQYTVHEAAELTGIRPRTIIRRYHQSLDRLTRIFLAVEMLQPQILVKGQNDPEDEEVDDYMEDIS